MSIVAAELVKRGALNRPEDDVSSSGGGIDNNCVLDITQLAANDVLRVVSDNAGDTTQNVTVTGRLASGAIDTDVIVLNGVTPVAGAKTFERILKINLSATAAGNVTIERNTNPYDDVVIVPAGKTDAAILFIDSSSEVSQTVRYEKEFWKNENGTTTLNAAKVTLTADPSTSIKIGVETAINDIVSVTNRKTVPSNPTFVDDGVAANVPGNALAAGAAIGVWIEMTRATDAAALKSSYTTKLEGTTV